MKKIKENKNNKVQIILYLYIGMSIIFAIPSILYIIRGNSIYNYRYLFTCFLNIGINKIMNCIDVLVYISIFISLFILYFLIIKNRKKIFNNTKQMFVSILILAIIFMLILPIASLDVYSYIGSGWIASNYNENPYYMSVRDVILKYNEVHLMFGRVANCWLDEPVVYGPVWTLICTILTAMSLGNIDISLWIFKIVSLIAFILCCYLIYKITNKKIYMLIFGLNPFILFETLTNVHNDIFLILFMLLGIYLAIKKKKIGLSVISFAIATGIKYLSVILLPFILIYALKDENIKSRIKKFILYGIQFVIILLLFYLIYLKDFNVLAGIFVQQNKYGRSIFLILYNMLSRNEQIIKYIKYIVLGIFTILYVIVVFKLILRKDLKNIQLREIFRKYNTFIFIFTFVLITNFNPWYVLWLFPTIMYQKSINIKLILYISFGAILSYSITYATKIDNESVGWIYLLTMILTPAIMYSIDLYKGQIERENKK